MAVNRTSTGNLQIFSRPFSSQGAGHCQQPLIHSLLIYRCGRALQNNGVSAFQGEAYTGRIGRIGKVKEKEVSA